MQREIIDANMAEVDDARYPESVNTEESSDLTTLTVKLGIPNIVKKKSMLKKIFSSKSSNDEQNVDVKFEAMSFEVNATVPNKGKTVKYHFKCEELPGEIYPDKSKFELQKDMVVVTLMKADDRSWAVKLQNSGL